MYVYIDANVPGGAGFGVGVVFIFGDDAREMEANAKTSFIAVLQKSLFARHLYRLAIFKLYVCKGFSSLGSWRITLGSNFFPHIGQ